MTELAQLHHQTWLLELPRPENREIHKKQREFIGIFMGTWLFFGGKLFLVGGIPTQPLRKIYEFVRLEKIIPTTLGKIQNSMVPNHQADIDR